MIYRILSSKWRLNHGCPSIRIAPCLTIAAILFAASVPVLADDFTLNRCLELAHLNNPELLTLALAEEAAAAGIPAASADIGPSVMLSATGRVVSVVPEMIQPEHDLQSPVGPITIPGSSLKLGEADTWEAAVTVSQTFYAGGRLRGAVDLATLRQRAVASRISVTRMDLDMQTSSIYLDLARLYPLREIARVRLDTAREHAIDVRHLIDAGVMTDNEGLKADLRVSEAEESVIVQDNLIISAMDTVARITAHRFNPPDRVPLPGIQTTEIPQVDISLQEAHERRPELAQLDAELTVLEKQSELTGRINRPVVTGYGKAAFGKPGPDFIAQNWIDYYEAGVQLRLNLWDNHRVDRRQDSVVKEIARIRQQRAAVTARIELEIRQAITRIRDARMRLEVANRAIVQAEENFRVVNDRFLTGVLTHTDYLDAESSLFQCRSNQLILLAEIDRAWLLYHTAVGHDLLEVLTNEKQN